MAWMEGVLLLPDKLVKFVKVVAVVPMKAFVTEGKVVAMKPNILKVLNYRLS